jgi:hypothetical protein
MCPDHRQHRGAHPEDQNLFGAENIPLLRQAVADLSWLLNRGYKMNSSLKLTGDRYDLALRQRLAVSRAACSDEQRQHRRNNCLAFDEIRGRELVIDGFNLIVTMEAALSGGLLILCRDGCVRDLSSVHGSYRTVAETGQVIRLIGQALIQKTDAQVLWLLDQPVSNSGRLGQRIRAIAEDQHWPWRVETVMNPDRELRSSTQIVITSDSAILDGPVKWMNLAALLISEYALKVWLVNMGIDEQDE